MRTLAVKTFVLVLFVPPLLIIITRDKIEEKKKKSFGPRRIFFLYDICCNARREENLRQQIHPDRVCASYIDPGEEGGGFRARFRTGRIIRTGPDRTTGSAAGARARDICTATVAAVAIRELFRRRDPLCNNNYLIVRVSRARHVVVVVVAAAAAATVLLCDARARTQKIIFIRHYWPPTVHTAG